MTHFASALPALPPEMTVLERGWLSANNIVFRGADNRLDGGAAVVDTGYCTHAAQTVALIGAALQGQPLERIFNTHLHSDHCGGNAALQAAWPGVRTAVPPGHLAQVQGWDAYALSYTPTGQQCPRFRADAALLPGTEVRLGVRLWQVHAAPGHDPHSIVLFEPQDALLISADALWENGFGVVFPELEGEAAFAEVAATLDLIERLAPRTVIPGHGPVFYDAPRAIDTARRRLDGFVREPLKHALHGAKVLLKYKLLEWQQIALVDVQAWALATPYFNLLHTRYFAEMAFLPWLHSLVESLLRSGAATRQGDVLHNA
ncbi:MAG: MBL fold metallo-hydrolase [Giesbergeria sp.]|nr:MBL fold metallo-hydrolase [Giesbergeria sp.]MBP6321916.1 MBL fold metallo-hydrolase [Giesbergeria sp.]MBP7916551.1 MBL fold metallo-hydrolase [Giesbergeria sp.]MBP8029236.1 MBL fold metallo-hydrolase [Giesbergeria sp.]MBP8839371.1 MBL fold metallo-hydrolase [Giesbergeria sp.]